MFPRLQMLPVKQHAYVSLAPVRVLTVVDDRGNMRTVHNPTGAYCRADGSAITIRGRDQRETVTVGLDNEVVSLAYRERTNYQVPRNAASLFTI